jgi:hypothetical protein
VAAVLDGSQKRLYINGQLDTSLASTHAPATGTGTLTIGASPDATDFLNGLIDEARVTAAAVYTTNFTPQASLSSLAATRGLWKFDGQSPNDSSGNGNNGTLKGGATYSTDTPPGGQAQALERLRSYASLAQRKPEVIHLSSGWKKFRYVERM